MQLGNLEEVVKVRQMAIDGNDGEVLFDSSSVIPRHSRKISEVSEGAPSVRGRLSANLSGGRSRSPLR